MISACCQCKDIASVTNHVACMFTKLSSSGLRCWLTITHLIFTSLTYELHTNAWHRKTSVSYKWWDGDRWMMLVFCRVNLPRELEASPFITQPSLHRWHCCSHFIVLRELRLIYHHLLFFCFFLNCISSDKCSTWRGAALGSIGWPTAVPSVEIKAILQR